MGEAIWSPKLYEYSVAIAPRGKEATYSAMSTTPAFLATGLIGGRWACGFDLHPPPEAKQTQ
eukprot:3143188-Amphidinium_carterae.1